MATKRAKDGFIMLGVPDGTPTDELKRQADAARGRGEKTATFQTRDVAEFTVPSQAPEPETTLGGLAGAAARGLAPVATGVALGAASPIPGGAAIGGGAALVGQTVIDPVINLLNSLTGGDIPTFTSSLNTLLTQLGVEEPDTDIERITEAVFGAVGGTGGQIRAGQQLAQTAGSPVARGVAGVLAEQPLTQLASGAAAGAGSQVAAESGAGPVGQLGAGLVAGGVPPVAASRLRPRTQQALAVADEIAPVGAVDVPPQAPDVPPVTPEAVPLTPELGEIVGRATGKGRAADAAREELASLASVDENARRAANELGIELPSDVFADDPRIRQTIGLARSQPGSEAAGAWETTVGRAIEKADAEIQKFGAEPANEITSERVRDSLVKTRDDLDAAAVEVFEDVDRQVPKNTVVATPNTRAVLDEIADELGGVGGMSSQEKKLLKLIDPESPSVTYGRLLREKSLMGKAIRGKESPYGNMEAGALKRLFAGLAEDQLDNVEAVGGAALRDELKGANMTFGKSKDIGKVIVKTFGEDLTGSIGNPMRNAIVRAQKGDAAAFNKLIKVVPEDLRREVVATAISSASRAKGGIGKGGFGFSEYADVYRGLRKNAPVFKQIVESLGPGSDKFLRDLFEVSRKVTDARAKVLTTGKANQAFLNSIDAEKVIDKIANSRVGRGVVTAIAAKFGGVFSAGAVSSILSKVTQRDKDSLKRIGDLFADEAFQKLLINFAESGKVQPVALKAASRSARFRAFAKSINLVNSDEARARWLTDVFAAQTGVQAPEGAPQPQLQETQPQVSEADLNVSQ